MTVSLPPPPELVLCATHRLARTMRLEGVAGADAPSAAVRLPKTATIAQWLGEFAEEALLCGEINAAEAPLRVLGAQQEQLLWEATIRRALGEGDAAALFDVAGLAAEARAANALIDTWQLDVDAAYAGEEVRRMLAWRETFLAHCASRQWVTPSANLVWQVDLIARGVGQLPAVIALAGFDRLSPLENRLLEALAQRGTRVHERSIGLPEAAPAAQVVLDDGDAECRAAARWVADTLAAHPEARIGIVVPDLSERRELLTRLLDHVLDPATVCAPHAQRPRAYNLSLGVRLADVAPVAIALAVLRLAASGREFAQTDLSHLLGSPYWGADVAEADGRARFDARLRDRLPFRTTLARVIRLARKAIVDGLDIKRSTNQLEKLESVLAKLPARQLPSAWAPTLARVLDTLGWPGERTPSSHDYQAVDALREAMEALAGLDEIVGPVSFARVIAHLADACADLLFQPQTEGAPRVQVLGLLEAAGERFDALWVMGMNDDLWPPPVRPSPLLPADLQRAARCPNASPEVQFEFAAAIHQRLLHAAPHVLFSRAERAGETALRASPLIADLPLAAGEYEAALTLGDSLCRDADPARLERIDDHVAPPVAVGESVRGGTGLFKTQAICPAWAFYRHRLAAKPLEAPAEGLDARDRGSLVHCVLEQFWTGRSSADLHALSGTARETAVAAAVDAGIAAFATELEAPLPPRFLALERERLIALLDLWLELELQRATPFAVEACEQEAQVEIEGIALRVVADRIDRLEDGRRVMLDYKTGAKLDVSSWAAERITEPQLPIYATHVASELAVAGIAFAQVRLKEQKFAGVAADTGILPGVSGFDDARKLFSEDAFPDWASVLEHWRKSLADIAGEIRRGEAAVRFTRERDLDYCDVLPILRLAERRMQYEHALAVATRAAASDPGAATCPGGRT